MPERLRPAFELLDKAVTEVYEGRLAPQRASAMASLTGAMVKIIKAGENGIFSLPPQLIFPGVEQWYKAIRDYRRQSPLLAGRDDITDENVDDEEVKALDEWERTHGTVKLPSEWI